MRRTWIPVLIVALLSFACGDSSEPQNNAPTKPTISPESALVEPNGSVVFEAAATDPDGDKLEYEWDFSAGTPIGGNGERLVWTAPATAGTVSVGVTVSDGVEGAQSSHATTVIVSAEAAFAHTIPDSATFEPDLSGLASEEKHADPAGLCHAVSAFAVGWANSAVFIHTAIPRLAFIVALLQPVSFEAPDTWKWAYTVEAPLDTAVVELQAIVNSGVSIDWEMRFSGTRQNLDRFLWVSGESLVQAGEGFWLLNEATQTGSTTEALLINWRYTAFDERTLQFINVKPTAEAFGDTLHYSIDGTDAFVRYHDIDHGITLVDWDVDIGDGFLVNAQGDTCCWGPAPQRADIPCP